MRVPTRENTERRKLTDKEVLVPSAPGIPHDASPCFGQHPNDCNRPSPSQGWGSPGMML